MGAWASSCLSGLLDLLVCVVFVNMQISLQQHFLLDILMFRVFDLVCLLWICPRLHPNGPALFVFQSETLPLRVLLVIVGAHFVLLGALCCNPVLTYGF
jgi:hypothetical protein